MLRLAVSCFVALAGLGLAGVAPCSAAPDGGGKFVATDGAELDQLGGSIAVHGNEVLVGASGHDGVAFQAGAAYQYDGQTGALVRKLVGNNTGFGDLFGWSVALGPNHAVVGAPRAMGNIPGSGAVYVFDRATGTQLQVMTAVDGALGDDFGSSVALDGDRVVVGAPFTPNLINSGAAYVFDLNSGAQIAKLVANDGATNDTFGTSVGIFGDRVLVGSPLNDEVAQAAGAAYVFDANTGAQLSKWTASDGLSTDFFGWRVDLHGDLAVIGATGCDDRGSGAGAAYVYSVSTGQELAKLLPQDLNVMDNFGFSVAIHDGRIAVSANLQDGFAQGPDIGGVYLFDAPSFAERAKLIPPGITSDDVLGSSVDLHESFVVAGTWSDDEVADNAGAAYVFPADSELVVASFCNGTGCPCGNNSLEGGCVNSSSGGGQLLAAGTGSLACDDVVLTARRLPANSFGILVMGSTSQSPMSLGDGLLCLSGSLYRFGAKSTGPGGRLITGPGLAAESCSLFGAFGCIAAGSTWNFQAWARDTTGPCGNGSNTTNAVALSFTP